MMEDGEHGRLTRQYPSLPYSKSATRARHLVPEHTVNTTAQSGGTGGRGRTDTRERSTSAVRSSRSCPGARASHSVASLMKVKDAPSAGRLAAVESFNT